MRNAVRIVVCLVLGLVGALCAAPAAHATHRSAVYAEVQASAEVTASALSRRVTLVVHLRNIGPLAAACAVKASGETRMAGLSIDGTADVTFDSLGSYRGFTVVCHAN